jgi:hypothetical protein
VKRSGPPCSVCKHPELAAIDCDARPVRTVSARFGIPSSTLQRHRDHRAVETKKAARPSKPASIVPSKDLELRTVLLETLDSLRRGLVGADASDVPRITGAITRAVKELRDLLNEQELTWGMLMKSPLWNELLERLFAALKPYPEAARAVVEAFKVAA